jgi:Bacteriophage HK97-gp10, putative tail-component
VIQLTQFLPDPKEIAKLTLTPEMLKHFQSIADMVAQEAKQLAPVDTGAYQDSIVGEAVLDGDGLTARVNAYDFKAWWIEVGTEDTPAFAPLRLGAELAGFHVEAESGGEQL